MRTLTSVEIAIAICGWVLFLSVFIIRPKRIRRAWIGGDRRSLVGMALQMVAVGVVRGGVRPAGVGLAPGGLGVGLGTCVLAAGLMAVSIWLACAAVTALGEQWSLAARLIEGHELITSGPYALVRHPIYTAMLGMIVGSALAVSRWQDLVPAVAVFLLGTALRVHSEERLLAAEFGEAYRAYAHAVPALIPRAA